MACEQLRSDWQSAEATLTDSLSARNDAAAAVAEAQAALSAAEASYDAADAKVSEDATSAGQAYEAWLGCVQNPPVSNPAPVTLERLRRHR